VRNWFPIRRALLASALLAASFAAAPTPGARAQDKPPEAPPAPVQQPAPPKPSAQPAPQPVKAPDPTQRDLKGYRLRVEDEIEVTIHKPGSFEPQLTRTIIVPANGEVSFSPIGKLNLLGRTATEIEEVISQRLKDENFLTQPNVGVLITKYAPRTVSVIGAVRVSVPLPVNQDLRLLDLLSRVGGLDIPDADFSRVEIRRIGADGRVLRFPVNVDDVFTGASEEQNVVVREGDIIKIPRLETAATPQSSEFVYVLGKVAQRGRIPIVRGRTPFTLVKLIAICGDFQEFADRTKIRVVRQTETGRQQFIVDFDDIIEGDRPDFELKPDDVIFVPESFL
jgi:polysaccharide export outer membrane protein